MTKEEYSELLKRPSWKKKRIKILERDNHTCQKCGKKTTLQVHHTYYIEGNMPWQVPDSCLITLCGKCHEKEHEGKDISSFVRSPKKKKKEKRKNRSRKKSQKDIKPLMGRDRKLQERYTKLRKEGKLL